MLDAIICGASFAQVSIIDDLKAQIEEDGPKKSRIYNIHLTYTRKCFQNRLIV